MTKFLNIIPIIETNRETIIEMMKRNKIDELQLLEKVKFEDNNETLYFYKICLNNNRLFYFYKIKPYYSDITEACDYSDIDPITENYILMQALNMLND